MDGQVTNSLGSLLDARMDVCAQMARLAEVRPLDREALGLLREVAHGFANQADMLLLTLATQGAPEALVGAVEEVFDALRDAESQIDAVIKRGRR